MGLPRANRLTHRRDFSAVYRHGTRFSSPHLMLRTLPISASPLQAKLDNVQDVNSGSQQPHTRIGIVVSQKVDKRAVVRNRIKRRLQAAFMTLRSQIQPGWLLVVGVRPQAVQCEYEQFLQELEQLLADAEVFNGN
ncbi:MAG: ribonuclease P protein component [Thainema sp.]